MKSESYMLYSSLPLPEKRKNMARIDGRALAQNYTRIREAIGRHSPNTECICVIKADAYGHGADYVAHVLCEEGCRFFAVSSFEEAVALRRALNRYRPAGEILILGAVHPTLAGELSRLNLITTVYSEESAVALGEEARRAGVRVRVHVKVDTGMNRIGFVAHDPESLEESAGRIAALAALDSLDICGIFSHFARADEEPGGEGESFTHRQAERFHTLCERVEALGLPLPFRHICNSAGALRYPEYHYDAVRVGIALYGVSPSRHAALGGLLPVMRLMSVITHIHTAKAGESVSYGGIYTTLGDRTIATLPIGYADGFLRAYSGSTVTLIRGDACYRVPIVGRICMDQCMIDVTDTGAQRGDSVILFGDSPDSLETLAAAAHTIPYECLCAVSSRVVRVYSE